jgi:hypothetical protein
MTFSSRVIVAALVSLAPIAAFVPSSASSRATLLELNAASFNRRDAVGVALAGLFSLAGNVLPADASNPALQTFKGGKKTKGSFIPGKGIRQHDEEEELLIASNPGTLLLLLLMLFVWLCL